MKYIQKIGENLYITDEISDLDAQSGFINIGYKPVHEGIIPNEYDEYVMELTKDIVEREDGDYEYKYTAVVSKVKIEQSITTLKQQLSESDYKVIKNMEAQLANEELPYDSVTLHAERQALRDKINELEELLKNN